MNKKTIIYAITGTLLVTIIFIIQNSYFTLKAEGAIEAAHVFVSPSHQQLFNEYFTPYPVEGAQRCIALQDRLNKSQGLELIDQNRGAYTFSIEGPKGELIKLVFHHDIEGKWGVECAEEFN